MIVKKFNQVEPTWVKIDVQIVTRGEVTPRADWLPKLDYWLPFVVTNNLGTFHPGEEHLTLLLFEFLLFSLTKLIRNGSTKTSDSVVKLVIISVTIQSHRGSVHILLLSHSMNIYKQGINWCSILGFCHQSWLQNVSFPTQKGDKKSRYYNSFR